LLDVGAGGLVEEVDESLGELSVGWSQGGKGGGGGGVAFCYMIFRGGRKAGVDAGRAETVLKELRASRIAEREIVLMCMMYRVLIEV